jgi:hypothetical protein
MHDDRLIILDPADTEWPLKLNLFDVNRARLDQLPRGQREQILAGIIDEATVRVGHSRSSPAGR